MATSLRVIRGRIKSIKNTRKITKAMELVAAAKMRKAVSSALSTRPFARYSWDVLSRIVGRGGENEHPLLTVRDVRKVLVILITPNRGLVGGLIANLLNYTLAQLRDPKKLAISRVGDRWHVSPKSNPEIGVVTIGAKGLQAMARLNYTIVASFDGVSDSPTLVEARPIAQFVMEEFLNNHYDKVVVCYSDFVSAVSQKPRVRQLLPVSSYDFEKMIAMIGHDGKSLFETVEKKALEETQGEEYIFEPDKSSLLEAILPKIVTVQLYQALLEGSASEHSSRMVAMKNASDAAKDIIDDLELTSNQVRQAGITREIAEISSGKAALE